MVGLKLKCPKIPIEISSGWKTEFIVLRVKVDRLMRVPMNEKKSRAMDEPWNILETLSKSADAIIVEYEKEETLNVEES